MNFDTAIGKTLKTLIYVVLSAGVVAGLSYVSGHTELFNPTTVGLANVLLVLAKNLQDKEVKNI